MPTDQGQPEPPREMQLFIYSRANPGVFSRHDAVGIRYCCEEQESTGGMILQAQGGTVVAECLRCHKFWALNGLQTLETGPMLPELSNPLGQLYPQPPDTEAIL